jgi:molecular chaperone HtpG
MSTKQFQAESKRLLDLMINSVYTHREIFLRELISNASDAIDRLYYKALTDDSISFDKESYYIKIAVDKDGRTFTITDTGMGMTKEELDENLGVIAKSGSLHFKSEHELKDGHDIIGEFGVGFYSAFMVADTVTVRSKSFGSDEAFMWKSQGPEGYEIEPCTKDSFGTEIILNIKENTEDENFDEFLEVYRIRSIIKKYSDFIRYPIKMDMAGRRLKEVIKDEIDERAEGAEDGTEDGTEETAPKIGRELNDEEKYEDYIEEETVNSMVPIWKKNKNELTKEDYENFYMEKHYGFDKPIKHIHISVDGAVSYNAILFVPEKTPFNFYTKEYEKGLELYSSGVMIMNKCGDLLPDYFGFVKGMVDSEDLSLNISREMLQHDRQLKLIAKNIKTKIKSELEALLKSDRDQYELFYPSFGRQLNYGLYSEFGMNRDVLEDLLIFYSSTEKKLVTLQEYVSRMSAEQKYIYYAAGASWEKIEKLPKTELVADKGYEILYFTEDIDEFAIKILRAYQEKEFKSVSSGDLEIEGEEENRDAENLEKEKYQDLFEQMKAYLGEKVSDVRASKRLKSHPVCLSSDGELTIEMEKVLRNMPQSQDVKANKILEINLGHEILAPLEKTFTEDREKFNLYTDLLYNQALLIEGLPIDDPVEFSNNICRLMQ